MTSKLFLKITKRPIHTLQKTLFEQFTALLYFSKPKRPRKSHELDSRLVAYTTFTGAIGFQHIKYFQSNVALLYIFAVSQCDLTHRVREGHLFFFLSVRYRNTVIQTYLSRSLKLKFLHLRWFFDCQTKIIEVMLSILIFSSSEGFVLFNYESLNSLNAVSQSKSVTKHKFERLKLGFEERPL